MMKRFYLLFLILAVLLSACASVQGDLPEPAGRDENGKWSFDGTVLVGRVVPLTGTLASFGSGTPYVEQLAIDAVNEKGGVILDGKRCRLELRYEDSRSEISGAEEAARRLIADGVDVMIVSNTADTVLPVAAVCEHAGLACISVDAPASAWLMGGPYQNSWHAFFDNEREMLCFHDCWEKLDTNRVIGLVTANDNEGVEITTFIHDFAQSKGYRLVDPGRYSLGQQDYSEMVSAFSAAHCDIILGVMTTADFAVFWECCRASGYCPKMCTMAKSCLFVSDVEQLPASDGLITEVWWRADFPFISSIDGTDCAELADRYLCDFAPELSVAPPTLGYKYANVEILADILSRAGSLRIEEINRSAADTDLDTIVGHVAFRENHVSVMSCVAGQWIRQEDGSFRQEIVGNYLMPTVPLTAEIIPIPKSDGEEDAA